MTITIINGGTQGLGEAVARALVEKGSNGLVLTGRSRSRGEALAAELQELGTHTIFVEADMNAVDAPNTIVEACDKRFGTVNGLVNVAATTTRANLLTDTPEHFDRQMAVNAKAPYFLIQATVRLMLREGATGSIVNVGSVAGHGGAAKLTSYAMSKGALTVMTKNLAYGLMRHKIRVNQVNPGWMDTESEHWIQVNEDGAPEDWLEKAERSRPLGRLVKPWEVANVIAFCLSPDSGVMTGNCIDVDQSVQGAGDPHAPNVEDSIPI